MIYGGYGVKNGSLKSATGGFEYFTSADVGWYWEFLDEELEAVPVEESELPKYYDEPQEPSNTEIVKDDGENLEIEGISQIKVEEIALEQCKVNYDYIKTDFNHNEKRWSVEFWENIGKVPTQTILIDTEGNVVEVRYAE